MNRSLLWRGLIIAAAVAIALIAALPLKQKIKLGLDLRGGIHLVLKVHTSDAVKAEADKSLQRVVDEAKSDGAKSAEGERTAVDKFVVTGVPSDKDDSVAQTVHKYLPGWKWQRNGNELDFGMTKSNESEIRDLAVKQALETIRNRIDQFGVTEPVIEREGLDSDRIVVQLPGVDDPERVKALIKNTAFLEFRLVQFPSGGGGVASKQEILDHYHGKLPSDIEIKTGVTRDKQGHVIGRQYYAVNKRPVITGRDLKNARPGLGRFNQPVVNFFLTHDGAQLFAKATGDNIGKGLAIILDNNVESAPRINDRISDSGVIEGHFTQQQVQDLSTVLRSGALPAGISYLEERTVGPSLGQDSIREGLRAGLIGAILVVLTMLVIYKGSGINAILALALNMVLIFGSLAYFHAVLTLPGIAGIVLTIGMAVDANVLIFERIREELRAGKTVKSSIDAGFAKALSSILDANITTLIAALFLFQFGTGPIRGFAVTLSIGILASLFTAIFVSRWIFDLVLSRRKRVDTLSI